MRILIFPFAALLLLLANPTLRAQGPPMFTHDYYLMEPARWVDKKVSISVTHVGLGEDAGGGKRRMEAHTYYNRLAGGKIDVVAPDTVAVRIIRQCGTTKQPLGKGNYRTTQLNGTFKREASGGGRDYYLLVEQ